MENNTGNSSNEVTPFYKFKDIKVYCSVEWLLDNKKRYRQVFNRYELDYIYVEVALHNKRFDSENWDADVTLKCFDSVSMKQLCSINVKKKISKFEDIAYIREGWGNKKKGSFWKKGNYFWQIYIDGELIGTKYFYIVDFGKDEDQLPISVNGISFYEEHYDDMNTVNKKYCTTFDGEQARFIFTEVSLENFHIKEDWNCEMFLKIFNASGELKGEISRLQLVEKRQKEFKLIFGYGSNTPGSWHKGTHRLELVGFNKLIANTNFTIGDEFISGQPEVNYYVSRHLQQKAPESLSFQDVFAKLDEMVGLNAVKTKLKEHAMYMEFIELRKERGFVENHQTSIYTIFSGNPGTGKTTVAKLLGSLYASMGLLSKGHVHVVDRSDLVGEFIGQTAPKVKEAIKKAKGGILFIDEAYALARTAEDAKDFGKEAIEILVKEMSEQPNDFGVIAAGYPKEMKTFLNSNPGLMSRFKTIFDFQDYTPQELNQIATSYSQKIQIQLNPKASEILYKHLVEVYRNRDKSFGNARYVENLLEQVKMNMGIRLMQTERKSTFTQNQLKLVTVQDIEKFLTKDKKNLPDIPVDKELLSLALKELDQLVGIQSVKEQIKELIDIVTYYKNIGKDVLSMFQLHTLFIGNPGTGKTTVARILSKIYKALGILERGHLIETDRSGLVAGYVGQTAIKTSEILDSALGGVLFIDEAYALANSGSNQGDFGNEAIQIIIKRMEDQKGNFFIFAAGYPDNMQSFLNINPGLSSRFDKMLKFEDYTADELVQIAVKNLTDSDKKLDKVGLTKLKGIIGDLVMKKDKYFGNARTVKKLTDEIIRNQELRLVVETETDAKTRTLITEQDVLKSVNWQANQTIKTKTIGFKA